MSGRGRAATAVALALFATGCEVGPSALEGTSTTPGTSGDLAACAPGAALAGASYDLTKSRFAFGSKPVQQVEVQLVRWVGADGALAIWSDGAEGASLTGGAPEARLAAWSADPAAVSAHVRDYFTSMGVAPCQLLAAQATGGSDGLSGHLIREVDGIPIGESLAFAHFDVDDQTTYEGFYWPTIPADVMTAARAFHARLAQATMLAAYKALLPPEAQGEGRVIIHHTSSGSMNPFQAAAVYDVAVPNPDGKGSNRDFDENGVEVHMSWL